MKAWRIILAILGILVLLYGIVNLFIHIPIQTLLMVAVWLVAALIIHDAVIAPSVVGVGWLLRRLLPDRARRYVQMGLIMAAAVTIIAIPMIIREGSQPPQKTLLIQNYAANLALLLGIIAGVTAAAYAVRVARDRSRPAGSAPPSTDPVPDQPA
jgi:hypothetical protein